jgi:hypothetical protein
MKNKIIILILILLIFGLVYFFNQNFFKINPKKEANINYIEGRVELNINDLKNLSQIKNLFIKSSSTENNIIPNEIFSNTQLETLALNNLGLKDVPSDIGKLTNLKMLYLNDNHLNSLPDSLVNLQKLEFLNIGGNDFEKIPEVLYQLKNLKKLIIVNNKKLPKEEQEKLIKAFNEGVVLADINFKNFENNLNATSTNNSTNTQSSTPQTQKNSNLHKANLSVPFGKQTFQVYQNENVLPKIWEVKVDPSDVRVGDKQKLSIVVESPYEIKEVKAITRLDNSTKTIDLVYIKEVSLNDLSKRKFFVFNNQLMEENNFVFKFLNKIFPTVLSSQSVKKLYEAEWNVSDTHDKIYYTTFYVKDALNNENSVTLAWSDACGIPNGGDWSIASYGNCTISSPDGVDNGNVTIQTYTLTLNSTFVFNPGKSIIINSGSIVLNASGQIQKAYLYLQDADNDNYIPQSSYTQFTNSSASWSSPYKRRYLFSTIGYSDCDDYNASIFAGTYYYFDNDADGYGAGSGTFSCSSPGAGYVTNNADCYDYNSNARPGQTSYFTVSRGDGSFDYNCDNVASPNYANGNLTCYLSSDGQSCNVYNSPAGINYGVFMFPNCSPSSCGTPNCTLSCSTGVRAQDLCGSSAQISNSYSCITSWGTGNPNSCVTPPYYTYYTATIGCQ